MTEIYYWYSSTEYDEMRKRYDFTLTTMLKNSSIIEEKELENSQIWKFKLVFFQYNWEYYVYFLIYNSKTNEFEQARIPNHPENPEVPEKWKSRTSYILNWNMKFDSYDKAKIYYDKINKNTSLWNFVSNEWTTYYIEYFRDLISDYITTVSKNKTREI